ncbi:MAG: hypothetical protein ACI8QZ_002399 [Chlamydiales bacterium]|jgi:hypothetical protein
MFGDTTMTRWIYVSLFLTLGACTTPAEEVPTLPDRSAGSVGAGASGDSIGDEEYVPQEDLPWTTFFMESSALLADSIAIEGPEGLIAHAAARADNAVHLRSVRTTKEGLLQEFRVRTDAVAVQQTSAIRGQLDAWQIMALRRLTILERPGMTSVRVVARGDAFFRDPVSGEEQRGDALEFVGELGE